MAEFGVVFLKTLGAQTVGKLGTRVVGDVFLDPLPALLIRPNALAMHADGK